MELWGGSYKGLTPKSKGLNMKCVSCENPNPDQWFYCRSCGKKTSKSKFTTNLYMRSEIGKRTDIEFSSTTIDDDIKQRNKKLRYA